MRKASKLRRIPIRKGPEATKLPDTRGNDLERRVRETEESVAALINRVLELEAPTGDNTVIRPLYSVSLEASALTAWLKLHDEQITDLERRMGEGALPEALKKKTKGGSHV